MPYHLSSPFSSLPCSHTIDSVFLHKHTVNSMYLSAKSIICNHYWFSINLNKSVYAKGWKNILKCLAFSMYGITFLVMTQCCYFFIIRLELVLNQRSRHKDIFWELFSLHGSTFLHDYWISAWLGYWFILKFLN